MKNMYALFDSAASMYLDPFLVQLDAQAIRAFDALIQTPGSDPSLFPQDFSLYKIGSYEPITGRLTALEMPLQIITATELVHNKKLRDSNQAPSAQDEMNERDPYLNNTAGA